jgi:vacuolar-type H+-ATPase subunit I/STV1
MHSSVLIGRKGVPVICRNLLPSELRTVIQPDNDREEFLLLLAEEQHLRAVAAEQLGEDYDDSDDDELIGYKLSLAEKVERAESQVGDMLRRIDRTRDQTNEILGIAKRALLNQSMVASSEERLQSLLNDLAELRHLVGSRAWDDLRI